jgi:hypothetical protein
VLSPAVVRLGVIDPPAKARPGSKETAKVESSFLSDIVFLLVLLAVKGYQYKILFTSFWPIK